MIEVLKQALEALEDVGVLTDREWQAVHKNKANELRQAIAELESQEPVAWRFKTGTWWNREVHWRYVLSLDGTEGLRGLEPLYTHPPQRTEPVIDKSAAIRIATALGWTPPRTWVGLTDEEKHKTWYEMQNIMSWYSFQEIANAIEAKVKERNI